MQNNKIINGLIPAVVQDYYTGRVLMLAYVNQESYDIMQREGRTCFWSRSRKKLWRKGETSGDVQLIKSIDFDCDDDAMLIRVEQKGGACHLGRMSCFGDESGEFAVMDEIYKQIVDRKIHPQEKSYTNYLLNEGVDKICKKIGEEATETVLAAKNADCSALTEEIGDLAYHVLVLMLALGVSPDDVRSLLKKRHAKKNNLKERNQKGDL